MQKVQHRFSLPGAAGFYIKTLTWVSAIKDLLVPQVHCQQVCVDWKQKEELTLLFVFKWVCKLFDINGIFVLL
jgi:hypothetical protein